MAQFKLDEITEQMSPKQIEEAVALAGNCCSSIKL
jgi:hypothetical protein